jgi:hypothetical protein
MGSKSSSDDSTDTTTTTADTTTPTVSFEMPDFSSMMPAQPDYAKINADAQAKAEKTDGENQIRSLYSNKFAAADKATADVNKQVADEMAHAKTVGLDYSIDDTGKQQRINNTFADYWSEGDEQSLTALQGKYGNAGMNWTLPIVRGVSTADAAKQKTAGDSAGSSLTKAKGLGATSTTDEDPLGSNQFLGAK